MLSDSDALPPAATADATAPQAPLRPAFPEHSLLSILIMLLLSAGVLYAMAWALREEEKVVQQWDFSAPQRADQPWTFPEAEQNQTPTGMVYTAVQTGPGPALTLNFDAATVRNIRVTMAVSQLDDGVVIPYELEWYWASPDDVTAAGESWPFSTDRGATFVQPDRHKSDVRLVQIHQHPRWRGPIAKAFLSVKLPDDATGPFRIETKKIEFLE